MLNFLQYIFSWSSDPIHAEKVAELQQINTKPLSLYTITFVNESNPEPTTKTSSISHKLGGYICIILFIFLWLVISEIIPILSTNYNKPLFIRYCVGSSFTLLFPISYSMHKYQLPKLTRTMLYSAFFLSVVYYCGLCLWYMSLNHTITAINNTLSQTSLIYTYILSIFLPNYKATTIKTISVIICILGVILIGISSSNDHENSNIHNTVFGIVEVILSSILMAVYSISIKYFGEKYYNNSNSETQSQFDKIRNTLLMQSLIGIFTLFTVWPFLICADWIGVEKFELPETTEDIIGVLVIVILNLFWAMSIMLGIALTNPVLMAMSGLLVMPLTFGFDFIFYQLHIGTGTIIGSVCIIIGFILMECPLTH